MGMMAGVVEFRGEFRFLSNFWPARVRGPGNRVYATVEQAYQASKSLDRAVWREMAALPGPGAAKTYARTMAVRADWPRVRLGVMERLLRQKFAAGGELAAVDGDIQEGNRRGDTFWASTCAPARARTISAAC